MTFHTKGGYVFPSVILILTLIISTLVYSASLQKSNIEIINNFKKNLIIEEEIKAIEEERVTIARSKTLWIRKHSQTGKDHLMRF